MANLIQWLSDNGWHLFEGIGAAVVVTFGGWAIKRLFTREPGSTKQTQRADARHGSSVQQAGRDVVNVNAAQPDLAPLKSAIDLMSPPLQDRMDLRDNVYWRRSDGQGPFCPRCVVADNKAAPMEDRGYFWRCLICRKDVRKRNVKPPSPPRPSDSGRDPVTGY